MDFEGKMISREISELLWEMEKTVSTAESCTGGRIGEAMIAVPGASKYFKGGIICYVNEVKENLLGVSHDVLALTTEVANTSAHTATIAVPTTRSWAAFALVWQLTSKRAARSSGDLEQLPSRYSASVCLPLFTSSCGSSHLPPLHPKTVCVNKVGTLRPTTWQSK